jgi:hypothetical protein
MRFRGTRLGERDQPSLLLIPEYQTDGAETFLKAKPVYVRKRRNCTENLR